MAPQTVADIMTKNVVTVTHNQTVRDALRILFRNNISGAPVVTTDGKVIGIVSSLDLIVAFGLRQFDIMLRDLTGQLCVKKQIIKLSPDAPIKEALMLIVQKRIGRVLVMDESQNLLGIVSRKDLLKYFATQLDV